MHIVMVTPELPPMIGVGGIGTHTSVVAPALALRGHDVTILTYAGAETSTTFEGGVRVVRLREQWLPTSTLRILGRRIRTWWTIATMHPRPDVVHAAEWQAEAVAVALLPRSAPLVTRLATPTYIVNELNGRSGQRTRGLMDWLERRQARSSTAIYAPSRAIATRIARDWSVPVTEVIPNSIDTAATRAAAGGAPPISLPERFVVFIGRLERRKGIDTLGRALAQVLASTPDLHAVLIGRDTGEAGGAVLRGFHEAVSPVADRVHLVGEMTNAEALEVIARAELAVLPSRWESFGFVSVEALALGVPVVASDVGGPAEIIEDGVSGWLVPPDDPDRLAEAVQRALDDHEGRSAASHAARRRAEHYDVHAVVERVDDLLHRVAGRSDGPLSPAGQGGYRRFFRPDSPREPFSGIYERKRTCIADGMLAVPPTTVLDIGGGFGRITELLRDHHAPILCDLSSEMLGEAAARFGSSVPLARVDAMRLPFADGAVRAAIAIDLLVHLPDLDAAVTELARIIEPGGTLVIDSTNATPWWVLRYPRYVSWRPRRLLRTLRGAGILPEWQATVQHQRRAAMESALGRAGLVIDRRDDIGPSWCPKWHVWWTRKVDV